MPGHTKGKGVRKHLRGDGPYVWHTPDGYRAHTAYPRAEVTSAAVCPVDGVEVPCCGDHGAFRVSLHDHAGRIAMQPASYDDDGRDVLVLGDTHGEFGIVTAFLRRHGVIADDLTWSFGQGHLVLLGDVFDRGEGQVPLLWLFYKLQGEALAAGGRFSALIGNHEAMILRGDLRYLHKRHARTAKSLGREHYGCLFAQDTVLGDWLRTFPAMVRLGRLLFVHGGVAPDLARAWPDIDTVNRAAKEALGVPFDRSDTQADRALIVGDRAGPLWYRGYFERGDKRPAPSAVRQTLAHFGADVVFVGHTPVPAIRKLLGGLVVAAHVYPERTEQGAAVFEGLLRKGGKWRRLTAGGQSHAFTIRPA